MEIQMAAARKVGAVLGLGVALLLAPSATGSSPTSADEAALRCPSAVCHSSEVMRLLSPDYRRCMSQPGAARGSFVARLACSTAEFRRQDTKRLKLQAQANLTLSDLDPRSVSQITEMNAKWDRMRDKVCRLISLDFPAGPKASHARMQCRAYLAIERSLFLNHVILNDGYN